MLQKTTILAIMLLSINHLNAQSKMKEKPVYAYVSSYSSAIQSDLSGLKVLLLHPKDGSFTLVQEVESINASWIELAPDGRFLYACYSLRDKDGNPMGAIEAYTIDATTGKLTLLNRMELNSGPAQLAVSPDGKHLILANYFYGDYMVLSIENDGRIGTINSHLQNEGKGIASRQEAPHPHAVVFSPNGQYIGAADLGIDKVESFHLEDSELKRVSEKSILPGTGPRHIAFSRDGRTLYAIGELDGKITAFSYDGATGKIGDELQTIATTPTEYSGNQSGAEIAVHPSGKFLYASNRGSKTVAVYKIEGKTGKLSIIHFVTEGITNPTSFAIDPEGKWLYVPNNGGENIVQFSIDQKNGKLVPTGKKILIAAPNVMTFRKPK